MLYDPSAPPTWRKTKALQRFDRQGTPSDRRRLVRAMWTMKAHGLSPGTQQRICALLEASIVRARFRTGPEGKPVAEILQTILDPKPLLALLSKAEGGKRLHPGEARKVLRAFHQRPNPYLDTLRNLCWGLELIIWLSPLGKSLRRGRPRAGARAALAGAIAIEVRQEASGKVWKVVADVVGPFIQAEDPKAKTDAEHLRKLVVLWKRRPAEFAAAMRHLYSESGLEPPSPLAPPR